MLSNYSLLRVHSRDVRPPSSLMKKKTVDILCVCVFYLFIFCFPLAHNLRHEEDKRGNVQEK